MVTIDARPVWEQLYQDSYHSLLRLAVLLTGDRLAAEDAVQDAFVGFWRRIDALDNPDSAPAYLRTAVVNNSRSVLRRRQTAGRALRDLRPPDPPGADHALMAEIRDQELRAAVAALPRRQREVVVLRYWSELSLAEVAATLGVSVGTVKSSASRAMDRLEKTVGKQRMSEHMEDRLRRMLANAARQEVPDSTPVPVLRPEASAPSDDRRVGHLRPWMAPAVIGVAAAVIAVVATVVLVHRSGKQATPNLGLGPTVSSKAAPTSTPERGTSTAETSTAVTSTAGTSPSLPRVLVVVPALLGLGPDTAAAELARLNLKIVTTPVVSTDANNNRVVGLSPVTGTAVRPGTTITVSIGNGPDFTTVPTDLVGKSFDQAAAELKGHGLTTTRRATASARPAGEVLSLADLRAGARVPAGTPVVLRVSDNSLFTVPNLANLTLEQAAVKLTALGWKSTTASLNQTASPTRNLTVIGRIASGLVGVPNRSPGSPKPDYLHVTPAQTPAAGAVVSKTDAVSVVVYVKQQIALPEFRVGVTTVDEIQARVRDLGFTDVKLVVQAPAIAPAVPFTFISISPDDVGTPVDFDTPITITAWGSATPR